MADGTFHWTAVEQVAIGRPADEAVNEFAEEIGARRIFLVAGAHLRDSTGHVTTIEKRLGSRHARSWSGIGAHAPRGDVLALATAIGEAQADLVVAIGGGSVIDAAKIAALALANDVRTIDDFDGLRVVAHADGRIDRPTPRAPSLPLACVPTTLSGAEFNSLSGATDEKSEHKQAFDHRRMAPRRVVLDPRLTLQTPQWLWLSTGIRAVDHAVETLASPYSHSFADDLAKAALERLSRALPRVKDEPSDLDARLDCQIGAWQAALPMVGGVPMGASHAIGHVLGGTCEVPHGVTSCIMAPYVQQWNAEWVDGRHQAIAQALGDPSRPVWEQLDRLIAGLGLPRRLAEVGVTRDRFPIVAALTLQDIWGATNPRPIRSEDDVVAILNLAA